ncbi:pseudouridine synthase [Mycoplasma sp. CAG:956]|nr:pseudouridine synthase [Mycoplasma sp. CAG:956]
MIADINDVRIDKYIADNTDYSRNLILNLIKNGDILVNDSKIKPSYKVKQGDKITINNVKTDTEDITPWDYPLDIVFEDDDIIIINKPSGMVVHPGNGNKDHTLVNALKSYTDKLSDINGVERLGIVHRIDKDTSGLIMIAKTNKAHEILGEYFKEHSIKREYIALLCGIFPHDTATIDAPIGRDEKNRLRMTVTPNNSKKAITHLEVLKRYKAGYTLVKARLETGRTHQIRVHTKYIGYPVYNDPVYSNKSTDDFGQFLHSYSMEFIHPITKEKMYFKRDVPKYFKDFLDKLDNEEKLEQDTL